MWIHNALELAFCISLTGLMNAQASSASPGLPQSSPKQMQPNPAGTVPPSSSSRYPNPAGTIPPPRTGTYPTSPNPTTNPALPLIPAQIPSAGLISPANQAPTQDRGTNNPNPLNDAARLDLAQDPNSPNAGDRTISVRNFAPDDLSNRHQQLGYQYGGFRSLSDPDVQSRLKLTPDQIRGLKEHLDWSERRAREVNLIGVTDPAKGAQLYREYWDQRHERLNKFLTPQQQKVWTRMTGEPDASQSSKAPR